MHMRSLSLGVFCFACLIMASGAEDAAEARCRRRTLAPFVAAQGEQDQKGIKRVLAAVSCPVSGNQYIPSLCAYGTCDPQQMIYGIVLTSEDPPNIYGGTTERMGPNWKICFDPPLPARNDLTFRVDSVMGPGDGEDVGFEVVQTGGQQCVDPVPNPVPPPSKKAVTAKKGPLAARKKTEKLYISTPKHEHQNAGQTIKHKGGVKTMDEKTDLERHVYGMLFPLGVGPPVKVRPGVTKASGMKQWEVWFDTNNLPPGDYRLRVVTRGGAGWENHDFHLNP